MKPQPITFNPAAQRCTGACEAEACNCARPRHLAPAESCTELGAEPRHADRRVRGWFWRGYLALVAAAAGAAVAHAAGWL